MKGDGSNGVEPVEGVEWLVLGSYAEEKLLRMRHCAENTLISRGRGAGPISALC